MKISKIRDTIMVLTLIGTWLMMPPMLEVFQNSSSILGMPMIVVYLFGVWLALIMTTALVVRRIRSSDDSVEPASEAVLPHLEDAALPEDVALPEDAALNEQALPPPASER
jgi:cytoskeletal protein RodZ